MRKNYIPFTVGVLVAVVIGFGINALLAAVGSPPLVAAPILGVTIGSAVTLGMRNAATRKRATKAAPGDKAAALSSPPPPGMARVVVYREGAVGASNSLDLSLGGRDLVQLQGKEFTVLTLAPGRFILKAALAGAANAGSKPAEAPLDLEAGASVALRVTLAMKLTTSDVVISRISETEARPKLARLTMVVQPG